MNRLPPDIKARWIAWLRDDNNRQTTQVLARESAPGVFAHCCLGGLGKVCGLFSDQLARSIFLLDSQGDELFTIGSPVAAVLRQMVPAECDEFGASVKVRKRTDWYLSYLNDNRHMSFREISLWIEKHL